MKTKRLEKRNLQLLLLKKQNEHFPSSLTNKREILYYDSFKRKQIGSIEVLNKDLQITHLKTNANVKDCKIILETNKNTIISQYFILKGKCLFNLTTEDKCSILKGSTFIDYQKQEREIVLPKDKLLELVILSFSLHYFLENFNLLRRSGIVNKHYKEYLIDASKGKKQVFHINSLLEELMFHVLTNDYTKETRHLYLKTKIHESQIVYFENLHNESKPKHNLSEDDIERMQIMEEYLSNFISDPIHLQDLSKKMGMSETDMQVKFKLYTGKTIIQFHREYVLKHSIHLIRKGESIKSIAYTCGYSSTAAYSKAFKKYLGYSPSELNFNIH